MPKTTLLILLSLSIFVFIAVSSSAQISVKLINPSNGGNAFWGNVGDTFDVQVEIDTKGESINGYSIYISIDDSLIQAIDQNPSKDGIQPFLQGDFLSGLPLENNTHDEPNGIDKFQLDYTEIQLQGGKSGQGLVATLKFRAVADGTTTINFDFDSQHNRVTRVSFPSGSAAQPATAGATVAIGGGVKVFVKVSGDNQTGMPNETLPVPYVVSVKQDFLPLSGQKVTFEVTSGGGNFGGSSSIIVYTNSTGEAKSTLTLGANLGTNTATATLEDYPAGPLTFTASAVKSEGVEIWIVSGDGQTGKVGTSLAEPFVVSVLDKFGNPAADSAVTFQIIAGGGKINGSSSAVLFTSARGEARATLTLGTIADVQNNSVKASLENGDAVTFIATAEAGEPNRLEKVSGDGQTEKVSQKLPQPLVVQITDRFGNPVSGRRVTFTVIEGDATINGLVNNNKETGEDGFAEATLTLGGKIGAISVKATAYVNSGSPQIFNASAIAGTTTKINKERGDGQSGIVGQSLKYPLVVSVKDDFFNPVSDELVIFEIIRGDGRYPNSHTIMEVKTDSEGKANVTPILGPKAGDDSNEFEVYLAYKPSLSVTFTASSVEGEPKNLLIEGGDNQVGTVGEKLPQPLSLILTDEFGNTIFDTLIVFEVIMGDGKIQDVDGSKYPQVRQWITTDEDGRAAVEFTLGSSATTQHRVKAYLNDDERVAVTFRASASVAEAAYLEKTSGDEQTGVVRTPLEGPLIVIVKDAYRNIVSDADVSFEVVAGGGTAAPNLIYGASSEITVKAGVDGRAIAWWTLGTFSGENRLKARIAGVGGTESIATFTALAEPDTTGIAFSRITEEPFLGVVGKPLENPLKVSIKDKFDNPVKNASILFKVSMGGGKLIEENQLSGGTTELVVKTDEYGEASVVFLLGQVAGRDNNIATASVMEYAGLPTIFFTASAEHDVPAIISKISGDEQVEKVAQPLPLPLTVVVKDQFDNPVPLANVQFSVIDGLGTLSMLGGNEQGQTYAPVPTIIQKTDEDGMALVKYFNGTMAGEKKQIVEVKIAVPLAPQPSPVNFVASALPDIPASLKLTSGDNQTGTVDTILEEPLVVTVVDKFDNPVLYTEVMFEVTAGGGTLFPVYHLPNDAKEKIFTQTDQLGQAKSMLILGAESGEHNNTVRVWVPGQNPPPHNAEPTEGTPVILFVASAKPATGVKLVKISGDGQMGTAGQQLPAPLVVVLRDHLGNPVEEAPVLFEVVEGGGMLSSGDGNAWVTKLEVKTDIGGSTLTYLKPGSLAGANNNIVRTWLEGIESSSVYFTASANALEADELIKTSGDNQTDSPGLPLPSPFVVTLVDRYNNPISGGTVNFTVKVGSGTLRPYGMQSIGTRSVDIATDEKGQAKVTLVLPTSVEKEHIVEANTTLLSGRTPIIFSARTIPDVAANLTIFSGNEQIGTAGKALPGALVVIAEDRFGNPIHGEDIVFEVIAGGGLLVETTSAVEPSSSVTVPVVKTTVHTDAEGKATVEFILGTDVTVVNKVKATLAGFEVIFNAMAKSTYATELEIFSGDGQTNTVAQLLPQPLVVLVKDQFDNPVEGVEVNFKVILGGGGLVTGVVPSLVPVGEITGYADIFGKVSVNLILGEKAGVNNNVVLASPVGFYSPSLYFRASAEASSAHKLTMIAGDGQNGIVGEPLNEPLIVEVTDLYDNPVPFFPLHFAVAAGDGLLEGGSFEKEEEEWFKMKVLETGSDGRIAVTWALGAGAGENKLEVRAGALVGSPITFTAVANVGSEIKLVKISGDKQIGIVGQPLNQLLKVVVSDDLNNPIPEAEVTFLVESGSGRLDYNRRRLNVMTDENGMAVANLTLGTKSGIENNIIAASILSLPPRAWTEPPTVMSIPVIFKATAEPDAPQKIFKLKGDNQRGIAGTVLLEPLVVTILDGFLNPVKDAIVTYEVKEGNGKLLLSMSSGDLIGLDSLEAVTDGNGQTSVLFQLAKNAANTSNQSVGSGVQPSNNGENRIIVSPVDVPDLKAEFVLYTNRPPSFTAPFDESQEVPSEYTKTTKETELLLFTVAAIDPDNEESTIIAENLPVGSTFKKQPHRAAPTEAQWQFTWRPTFAQSGDYKVTFIAADTLGNTSRQTVSITVQNNNRAPVMNPIANKNIPEGEMVSFQIEAIDPDDDAITYTAEILPELASLETQTGEFSWQPSLKQTGDYPITVYASDGLGGTATQSFYITVTDVNSPPKLVDIVDKQIEEGEPLEFLVIATDLDGEKLTYFNEGLPYGASLSVEDVRQNEDTTSAIFSWTPSHTQAGDYDVTIAVADGKGEKDSQRFTITVEDVNCAPTFEGQNHDRILLSQEGENIEFEVKSIDPEGGTSTLTAAHLPQGATFETEVLATSATVKQNAYTTLGKFSWTPDFTQAGNYEITFWATDNLGSSSSIGRKISVANTNRAPVILTKFSNVSISEGEEWAIFIEAIDPDGEHEWDGEHSLLEYKVSPMPEGASLVNTRFSWCPNFRQAGFYQLNFTVIDPNGGSDTKVAPLTVLDINHPPEISAIQNQTVLEGEELSFYVTATDADADAIILIANNLPLGASFDAVNEDVLSGEMPTDSTQRALFRWVPSYQQVGVYHVTFIATDNKSSQMVLNAKPEITVTIVVANVNQPPILNRRISGKLNGTPLMIDTSKGLQIYEGDELTFTLQATDNDDDNLSYGAYNIPPGAVFNIYNTFLWMPLHTQKGTYYVRFSTFDGVASDYMDLEITVLDKNQPPQISKIKDIHVEPGEEILFQISATDVDGDKFEYSVAQLPPGATFMETGLFKWIPLPTQVGTYKVTFIAKDASAAGAPSHGQSEQTVTITVGTDNTSAMSLPWDVNGDTVVDVIDLAMVGQHQGEEETPGSENPHDVNGDGVVDIVDMVLVGMHFGETLPSPAPALEGGRLSRRLSMVANLPNSSLKRPANRLYQNYPNPFNPETWIPYQIAASSEVSISIYDVRGRLVKTLELGFKPAGTYVDRYNAAHWNGRDERGEKVASGIYFYKIQAGQFGMVRKMVVVE